MLAFLFDKVTEFGIDLCIEGIMMDNAISHMEEQTGKVETLYAWKYFLFLFYSLL